MDILCPRCGIPATPAGHEDGRAFYRCEICNRIWMTDLAIGMSPRRGRGRVLVVDDSDQLVTLLSAWLEDEGYLVTTATTGAHAIAAAMAEGPEIVLLDLILPQPDGFRLCRLLRGIPRPPAIVVMTGVIDATRLRELDGLGVCKVLQKPLTQDAVLDAVSRARYLSVTSSAR